MGNLVIFKLTLRQKIRRAIIIVKEMKNLHSTAYFCFIKGGIYMEFIKLHALKIYTAEDVMCGDEPFYKAVMHEARFN